MQALKFPEKGSVFDYCISPATGELQVTCLPAQHCHF